jgi:NADPH2:quinone reductase
MKAIHVTGIGGPEVMKLVDVAEPEATPGMLRIANHAIAINFHDVQSRREGEQGLAHPYVPGTDFAGTIDAIGAGVEGFAIGERILGINLHDAYAEKTLVPAFLATRIPDGVSFEEAASCPVAGLTAYFLTHDNGVGPDDPVVVHAAAGSVGCFLGALLRDAGANSIGLVSTAAKAEIARAAGFRHVIEYRREDPLARVRELTGGQGARLVLDSVAGPQMARSFEMLRPGGTVVLFGRAAGAPPPDAILQTFLASGRNLGLRTYFLGTTLANELPRIPAAYAALFELFTRRAIALPMERLPLAAAADAHARLESQQTVGKLILLP